MTEVVLEPGWLNKALKRAEVEVKLYERIQGSDGKNPPSLEKLKKALALLR